jgi:hypothetical protein
MSTNEIELLKVTLGWETLAMNPWFWADGVDLGKSLIGWLLKGSGREACERVALYWNQHGRDDIAARIKSIIHQGDDKKP